MLDLITIIGPTASGKTSFAANIGYQLNGEILSGDSRQIYKNMDIGTGKDIQEYNINGKQIPFHLINIREAGEKYNLFNFQKDFHKSYKDIISRNKQPILCGGTGLYIESVLKGYKMADVPINPELRQNLEEKTLEELSVILMMYKPLHNKTDIETKNRAIRAIEIAHFEFAGQISKSYFDPIQSTIIGLYIDRDERRKRISERLKKRIKEEGLIDEVKNLLDKGISAENLIYYGLEYKYITLYILKKISYEEMYSQLETAIHQFAKRQMTWFRGMEKRGLKINWIEGNLEMGNKIYEALLIIEKNNFK